MQATYSKENILSASFNGQLGDVIDFVRQGQSVMRRDRSGATPLHLAAMSGHLEICRLLVSKKADINSTDYAGNTP